MEVKGIPKLMPFPVRYIINSGGLTVETAIYLIFFLIGSANSSALPLCYVLALSSLLHLQGWRPQGTPTGQGDNGPLPKDSLHCQSE